ncbi:MAG: carboxy terminal-processing peptidase [Bacteroidetes bacterium]|nr:carboxy terminal-processing peptidase [Bacteroidota bacterium]
MKISKKLFFILPAALALVSATIIVQSDKEEAIDQILMQSLNTVHYSPQTIDNNFSEKVYKLYLQRLDYNKKFLIQSDVEELKKFEKLVDDDINNARFEFFDKSFEIINKRVEEAKTYYTEILSKPFDFSGDETIQLDAEKINYAKDKAALKEEWRKSLKYQTLARMVEMMESQEKAKEKSDTVKLKSKTELEADARKKILKSNDDYFKRLKEFDRDDRIAIYFNAIAGVYDPHTEFFAPKDKANFDIGMTGQLEGIGAQLQEKDGYIKVSSIVPGSASYKQGQLKGGDIILKVGQGDAEPVDLTDMKLDDVVLLVRGKKGTEVRLTVKKPDASVMVISIIRDIVVLEDTYAQSVILKGKKNIGYIKLPSFYADFSGKTNRSCSKDIRKELEKLKAENVDGIILDLRYNGGGSLPDVVDMAGLFIDKGPVCQVKQKSAAAQVLEDRDAGIVYDGPLTVMVNSNSASASEIMAAAMQDYNRALIVGTSPSSFGKGTVQRFFNLDDYLPPAYANIKPLGEVKITTQKFYRINGGTTQLKGVIPDVILPDPYYLLDQGEKEQDYPMAWDEIAPAKYSTLKQAYSVSQIKTNSAERVKNNPGFAILNDAAKRLKKQKDNTVVSLNFDKYVAEQKAYKEEAKKMDALDKEIEGVEVVALKADAFPESDTVKVNKTKDWYKALRKDIYLNETVSIMNEMNNGVTKK